MRLIIIGGDVRNLCLAELARAHGHDVALIGHGESDLPPGGEYDAAALPYPVAEKDGRAPCAGEAIPMDAAMAYAAQGARVFAAKPGPALEAILTQKGCIRIDPSRDEAFTMENAAITAECALCAMTARARECLFGAPCAVVGYGRIGRALALRLRGVGAKVTVLARSAAARATARADGMDAEPIAGEHAGQWRFVFNTVPAGVAGEALLSRWVDSLPEPVCTEMRTLYAEMAALQTTEAKIYKALDKMEASVQHNESAIATWEPQEYALNLTYGVEQSQFSPYMQALREAIRQETLRKMEREGATPQP